MCLNVKRLIYILAVVLHTTSETYLSNETTKESFVLLLDPEVEKTSEDSIHNLSLVQESIITKTGNITASTLKKSKDYSVSLNNSSENEYQLSNSTTVWVSLNEEINSINKTSTKNTLSNDSQVISEDSRTIKKETRIYDRSSKISKINENETDSQKMVKIQSPKESTLKTVENTAHNRTNKLTQLNINITKPDSKNTFSLTTPLGNKNLKNENRIERRQYFRPPSDVEYKAGQKSNLDVTKTIEKDPKIEILLAEYRTLVNKYTKEPQNQQKMDYIEPYSSYHQIRSRPGNKKNTISRLQQGGKGDPEGAEYNGPDPGPDEPTPPKPEEPPAEVITTTMDPKRFEAQGVATRFTTRKTTTRQRRRTAPERMSVAEDCEYNAYYCLKAYHTGEICGRTLFFKHLTFKSYCLLDYVNCMERYDVWQLAHMGECFPINLLTEYRNHYEYRNDHFLDDYYIVEDM